jgi:hypothetical protein
VRLAKVERKPQWESTNEVEFTGSITTTGTVSGSRNLRTVPGKADAEALFALRKSELLRGVYKRPVKITFSDFGQRYMEHAKANKRSCCEMSKCLGT